MTDFLKDCKIVIINLKERQDKKKYILDLFKTKKLQYTFFFAAIFHHINDINHQ